MDIIKPLIKHAVYPAMELIKGNRIRANAKWLKGNERLPVDTLREMQREKLEKLLLTCVREVPAYRAFAGLADEIKADPFAALARFPVVKKADFRDNPAPYINPSVPAEKHIHNESGGSTSEPVRFLLDRETVEFYEAARWRGLSWHGIEPGDKHLMITGVLSEASPRMRKVEAAKDRLLKNRVFLSAFALRREDMPAYVRWLDKYRPAYVYGYVSALYVFAQMMEEMGLSFTRAPKCVVTTAETLYDNQRGVISRVFRAPVVNEYGAKDGGILAMSCSCGGLHETVENAVLEVVDPVTYEPAAKGEAGVLLVTELNNLTMPRLRYQIGDRAALSDAVCECGVTLPLLAKVEGREDDMFLTVDGRLVHAGVFNHLNNITYATKKFQIVQERPDYAVLTIVRAAEPNEEALQRFIHEVKEALPGTMVEVVEATDIPPLRSGKVRYGIRNFPLGEYME